MENKELFLFSRINSKESSGVSFKPWSAPSGMCIWLYVSETAQGLRLGCQCKDRSCPRGIHWHPVREMYLFLNLQFQYPRKEISLAILLSLEWAESFLISTFYILCQIFKCDCPCCSKCCLFILNHKKSISQSVEPQWAPLVDWEYVCLVGTCPYCKKNNVLYQDSHSWLLKRKKITRYWGHGIQQADYSLIAC